MLRILLWPVRAHKKLKGVGDRVRRSLLRPCSSETHEEFAQRLEDVYCTPAQSSYSY